MKNTITYIGKEANSVDNVTAGLIQRGSEIQNTENDTIVSNSKLRFQHYESWTA